MRTLWSNKSITTVKTEGQSGLLLSTKMGIYGHQEGFYFLPTLHLLIVPGHLCCTSCRCFRFKKSPLAAPGLSTHTLHLFPTPERTSLILHRTLPSDMVLDTDNAKSHRSPPLMDPALCWVGSCSSIPLLLAGFHSSTPSTLPQLHEGIKDFSLMENWGFYWHHQGR